MARESVTSWLADFAPSMGAGIAYYTAFSLAPLLVIVISVAGLFLGTAGSLVVLMLWVYYSAQIVLLGAEFTWLYAHRSGSRRDSAR